MEVTIHSTISLVPGRMTIATDNHATVQSLIEKFCVNHGLSRNNENLVLKNRDQHLLPSGSTLGNVDIQNRDVLFIANKDLRGKPFYCGPWWLLAAVMLLIGAAGMVAISVIKSQGATVPVDYGLVIDAGSSHSDFYVYNWDAQKQNGTAVVKESDLCTVKGGINSYEDDPSLAGKSLRGCMDKTTKQIPRDKQRQTPVYLGATAGMRLIHEVNKTVSDAIFNSVRTTLSTYPYRFKNQSKQARILSGKEEGSYGWVAVNFLLGSFGQLPPGLTSDSSDTPTFGALDMGGASTQMTFVPRSTKDIPAAFTENLRLYGVDYTVYTHSYLCYGLNEVMRRFKAELIILQNKTVISNPCGPKGKVTNDTYDDIFQAPCAAGKHAVDAWGRKIIPEQDVPKNTTFIFNGTSDLEQCQRTVDGLFNFNKTACKYRHCSFNGTFQPQLHGNFLAFSGYFYTVDFLNLTRLHPGGKFSLQEFKQALDTWCNKTWDQIKFMPAEFLDNYCLEGNYLLTLLTRGYGFNETNWKQLRFQKDVNGNKLGWSLGLMLNASNIIPTENPTQPISLTMFILLSILFILFILISIAFACVARRERRKEVLYEPITEYGSI